MNKLFIGTLSLLSLLLILEAPLPANATDDIPPEFNGVTEVRSGAAEINALEIRWEEASSESPPISYEIYISTESGGQNFSNPDYTVEDDTVYFIWNLEDKKMYYVVVRAVDSNGNRDNNTVELSAIYYRHRPLPPRDTDWLIPIIAVSLVTLISTLSILYWRHRDFHNKP